MKIVITVVGKDRLGIVSDISSLCKDLGINILDITQKVFDNMFAMVMLTEMTSGTVELNEVVDKLDSRGEEMGLKIHTMHEDIFNSMHKV